ncbi:MAG: hypothetical protein KKH12_16240 [Gammaproteobacteria bacterium]|nr:hypothetical protein [Gammaproteobacteria bacterium]
MSILWRKIPGFGDRYEVSEDGSVRAWVSDDERGGLTRLGAPLALLPCMSGDPPRMCYELVALTDREARRVHLSEIVRRVRSVEWQGERVVAQVDLDVDVVGDVSTVVVDHIRLAWSRRHLRRHPSVTVPILADMYQLTHEQVRAIVAGVEEVKA